MMGSWVDLKADDGHRLDAYVATPEGEAEGAVVVVQEIFGVNQSIRAVVETFAHEGFVAIAPALFDRYERNVELGYGEADMKRAFGEFYPKLDPNVSLVDVAAAFQYVKRAGKATGVVGFCYGGLMAWLSAVRGASLGMRPDCCVGYYPGGIGRFAAEDPVCPVILHFGANDDHIGKDQVEAVRAAHPEVGIFLYEGAGHAFANPDRPSYVASAAKLADERTLSFLKANLR
ncbi:MAG TPA: dienelactone hydrolase family protein [Acidobacteriaceae bacterium]|nr:dienelactone hydrolase family protein [Acidobacteriaceae bacterium]